MSAEKDRIHKWDKRFLELCLFFASRWSKDPSTQCGSVIVRNVNQIVQTGYNGYPAGIPDDESLYTREQKYARIIHAEINAIILAKQDLKDCTLYVAPIPPCERCAGPIIQAGIKRVVALMSSDPERQSRWRNENNIAMNMFNHAGIEFIVYDELILSD